MRKPDAEIFRRAVQKLGCHLSEAIYVGDNPQADIEGARAAGMKALWKRNNAYAERPLAALLMICARFLRWC